MSVGSGIETRSGACDRSGMAGISIVALGSGSEIGSSAASGSNGGGSIGGGSIGGGSIGAGSCGACMRENGVIGIGARPGPAMPVPGGGDWMDLKNGSPRTSLAGRARSTAPLSPSALSPNPLSPSPLSPSGGSSIFGAVAPDGPRSPRNLLRAAATLA
jgi:hypothetical protein